MYFSKFKSFSLIILLFPSAALSKCKFLLEFDELAINESGANYAAVGKIKIPISEDLDSFEFLIETDLPLTKLRVTYTHTYKSLPSNQNLFFNRLRRRQQPDKREICIRFQAPHPSKGKRVAMTCHLISKQASQEIQFLAFLQ